MFFKSNCSTVPLSKLIKTSYLSFFYVEILVPLQKSLDVSQLLEKMTAAGDWVI